MRQLLPKPACSRLWCCYPAPPRQVCVMKDNSAALLISCPSDKRDLDCREKHQVDTLNILRESQGEFGSPSPTPRKVDLQSHVLPARGRSAGLATGVKGGYTLNINQ